MKNWKIYSLILAGIVIYIINSSLFSGGVSTGDNKDRTVEHFSSSILEVPFDESMGKSETEYRLIFSNSDDIARYMKMKALYEKNLPSKIAVSTDVKIPRIIHQIWLGPNLPPSSFADFQKRWRVIHPDWEYHFWTETELESLNLDNWDLVEKSQNWAEKADIIRCDLLERFGGLYIDVDIDPCQSMEELHKKYDFYAGIEHPHKIATTNNRVWVGLSIMGAKPGHPILKNWKRRIRQGWDEADLRFSCEVERVINHTYFPFTYAVMQEIDQVGNADMLFPATYFYPISPNYAAKRRSSIRAIREKIYDFLERMNLKRDRAFAKSYPETIAVHYWSNLWIPKPSDQVREVQRLVDAARKDLYRMQQRLRSLENQVHFHEQKLQVTSANRYDGALLEKEGLEATLLSSDMQHRLPTM